MLPGLRGWSSHPQGRGGSAKHRTSTAQTAKGWLREVNKETTLVQMGIHRYIGHRRPGCSRNAMALEFLRKGPTLMARCELLQRRYDQFRVLIAVVGIP